MTDDFERLAAWREAINLDLLNAAAHLVTSAVMSSSATETLRRLQAQRWYARTDATDFFAPTGLRYMGELLERFQEKFGEEPAHYRAVALALAFTLPCAEDSMFVGNQRRAFMKRLRKDAEKDLYLLCALYLLEPEKQKEFVEKIVAQKHTDAAALIFALTILPADAFPRLRSQLIQLLGPARTLSVIGNSGLFSELLTQGYADIRACRTREIAPFKALQSLTTGYVRNESRQDTVLRANGYSRFEVCYLNAALIGEQIPGHDLDADSIPAEKLAVEFVLSALNSPDSQPDTVMDFIARLLTKYRRFEIKIEGHHGLWDAIKEHLQPECPETLAWMVRQINEHYPYRFDALSAKWNALPALVGDKYHELFRMQLEAADAGDSERIRKMLERYNLLTGRTYTDVFKAYLWEERPVFDVLVNAGVISLSEYFAAHQDDPGNSSSRYTCMHYISEYADKVQTRLGFEFWQWFFSRFTVRDYARFFNRTSFDTELIRCESYSYGRSFYFKLNVKRDFLTPSEQRKLYEWAEESFFSFHPDRYPSLLASTLQDDWVRQIYTAEELRATFEALQAMEPAVVSEHLKSLYFTEEEKQQEARRKELKREQDRLAEIERTRKEWMTRIEQEFDGSLASALKLSERAWRDKKLMGELLYPKVLGRIEACRYQLRRPEAIALIHLCAFFLQHDNASLETVKQIITRIEEVNGIDSSSPSPNGAE